MRGEGILSESHDERGRSFAPGRGKGRDAGPHCAAAECAGHAHRAVRRHIRSGARGAPRRLPVGAAPAWPRPGVVARHAGQSAEGYQGPGAARRRASPPRRRWRTIRASTSPTSKPRWARPIPTRPCPTCGGAVPACTSSGSWAPTICAASIAGSAGAASPNWCRSRSSIGWDRASMRPAAPRRRRWRVTALPEAAATKLADHKPPAWIYLHGLKSPLSSTALRAARALKRR